MLPSTAQTVVICADRDASGGKRAAHKICARTREALLARQHGLGGSRRTPPNDASEPGRGGMRPQQPVNIKPAR